jgi:hypothetical protein
MMLRQRGLRLTTLSIFVSAVFLTNACAVKRAANLPGRKDLSVLNAGTPRAHVVAELGTPIYTGEKDGSKTDMFKFKKGISGPAKFGRVLFHTAADLFTLFLWEALGTPLESVGGGKDLKAEVMYDDEERVKYHQILNN